MNNKKNRKNKKERKKQEYRTKEERQSEVKEILKQLNEFKLKPSYEPVKKLYMKFKEYISEGERIIINIPFHFMNFSNEALHFTNSIAHKYRLKIITIT